MDNKRKCCNPFVKDELEKHLEQTLSLILHHDEVIQISKVIMEVYGEMADENRP